MQCLLPQLCLFFYLASKCFLHTLSCLLFFSCIVKVAGAPGLSDYQWCTEHNINPGTFYNWVKRLRKKACYDIPPATGRGDYKPALKPDVVKLEVIPDHQNPGIPTVESTMLPLEEPCPAIEAISSNLKQKL